MTESIMLINETDDECRIAIAVDNVLEDLLIEHSVSGQIKNNIYRGTVVQVQTSLQAAFVDYGEKKHGFLPNSELNANLIGNKKFHKSDPIQKKLKVGQTVLVQVTREAVDHKGSALTTNITLPGRFMVLMPNSNKGGISKKIDDQKERDRLKGFLSGIEAEEHAVIIRTAGIGRSLTELKRDYTALKKTWNDIYSTFEKDNQPGLILEEADVVTRTMRDYYTEDISEVWVDNPETFQKALKFFKEVAPRRQKDLKLFVGDRSLFATYNIERQVEQLTSNEVKLRSGGSIVIDQTEALVAIDVNSGKSNQEGNIDSTALRTNLEAAEEIARQLRLRNLGGLIVVDFIDMENESYRRKVEEKMSEAMMMDKAQTRFNPISQFGLLEMSRQRLAVGISHTVESLCPICNGKGKLPSLLASTNQIIRSIREIAAKGNISAIEGELPLELVNHLLNERRQSISDLELEFGIEILLRGNPELLVFQDRFIKPVYHKGKAPQATKKETQKTDSKKRTKKQPQAKEQPGKKPTKEKKTDKRKPDQPEKEVKEVAVTKEVKVEEPVKPIPPAELEEENSLLPDIPKENQNGTTSDFGIHPACLFQDVQELGEEELEEVTTSFGNRLKGKIDNIPPQMIDNKYLWKTYLNDEEGDSKEETEKDSEEAEESEAVEVKKPTAKPKRRGRSSKSRSQASKSKKDAEEKADEKGEEKAKAEKKTSTKRRGKAKVEEITEDQTEEKSDKPAAKKAKPKSKSGSRTKTAKAKTAESDAAPSDEPAEEEKAEKGKRNTRSRKSTSAKAEKSLKTEEEKPKKKPATRGRKKTSEIDSKPTEEKKETKKKTSTSKKESVKAESNGTKKASSSRSTQTSTARKRTTSKSTPKKKSEPQKKES